MRTIQFVFVIITAVLIAVTLWFAAVLFPRISLRDSGFTALTWRSIY